MQPATPDDSTRVAEIHEAMIEATVGPYLLQRWQFDQMQRAEDSEVRANFDGDANPSGFSATVMPERLPYPSMVNWLIDRMTLTSDEYYAQLDDQARIYSFSMAGDFDTSTIDRVKLSLSKAFEGGKSLEDWRADLKTVLDDAGLAESDITKARAQLIYRNAWANANQGAKWQELQSPIRRGVIGMLRYLTIGDDRVRPTHAAMNKHTAPPDDPIWNTWRPPCGHNCRCTLITFTSRDVARGRVEASGSAPTHTADDNGNMIPVEPDPGWGSAPAPLSSDFSEVILHG